MQKEGGSGGLGLLGFMSSQWMAYDNNFDQFIIIEKVAVS